MKTKRTTHRSKSGSKLYAVRDARGRFIDIQVYRKAYGKELVKKHSSTDRK